jgi:hypothetical protein
MAKGIDEEQLRVEVQENGTMQLVVFLVGDGTTMDLAVDNKPQRRRSHLLALRAARRVLLRQVAKIEKMIEREAK